MILLSAAAVGLLPVFAPGPFSPGGSALAQELPTDDPQVNFRVIFYSHSFVSLNWGIPLDRGITGVSPDVSSNGTNTTAVRLYRQAPIIASSVPMMSKVSAVHGATNS